MSIGCQFLLTIISFNKNQFTRVNPVTGEENTYTVSVSGDTATVTRPGLATPITVKGSVSGGDFKFKWERATELSNDKAPPAASFNGTSVDWNLNSVGTLLDGVTYSVTFDVYPSQYTYDTIAEIENGDLTYDELDTNVKKYLHEDGTLDTNTAATLTYTDSRTDDGPKTVDYQNPPAVPLETEQMSVHKDWENELDARTVGSITMTVLMDKEDFHTVTLSKDTTPAWTEDPIYISTGLMRTKGGEMQILDPGHDFTFKELGSEAYNWELVAPVMHPMIINNVETMLYLKDDNYTNPEGNTEYEINGKTYYVVRTGETALEAYNYRRSNLNLTKVVTGEDAPEDATFPFTLTVKNGNAASGSAGDLNSDYYVWFSIYDTVAGETVKDATVSGATAEAGNTGYYYAPSGSTITVEMKAGWNLRFTNLPTDTTYTFVEGDLADGFAFNKSELEGQYGKDAPKKGTAADSTWKDGQTSSGTIQSTNTTYTVTYTNDYELTDLEITKVWDDANDQDGKRLTADELKAKLTLSPSVEGAEPTVVDNGDNTYTITYTGLPRYNNGQEVEYTVTESAIDGYTTTGSPAKDHGTITNTHTPEVVNISGEKTWKDTEYSTGEAAAEGVDNQYARPSSITIHLFADGEEIDSKTVKADDSGKWAWSFTNLPKNKNVDGTVSEIKYTITETIEGRDDYEATVTGYNVTNDPKETEDVNKISMTLEKTDANTKNKINGAVFTLTDPEGKTQDITVSGGSTTIDFTAPGTYTLKEKTAPEGYQADTKEYKIVVDKKLKSIELKESVWTWLYNLIFGEDTDFQNGTLTVPNTPEKTKVDVLKVWDDNNNQDGKRPTSVSVTMKGTVGTTEVKTDTQTLNEQNQWKYEWTELDAYRDGQKITYKVTEDSVPEGKHGGRGCFPEDGVRGSRASSERYEKDGGAG